MAARTTYACRNANSVAGGAEKAGQWFRPEPHPAAPIKQSRVEALGAQLRQLLSEEASVAAQLDEAQPSTEDMGIFQRLVDTLAKQLVSEDDVDLHLSREGVPTVVIDDMKQLRRLELVISRRLRIRRVAPDTVAEQQYDLGAWPMRVDWPAHLAWLHGA